MTTLIKYEAARQALAEASSVDEVKDIRDKALAMEAYARQAQDHEFQFWAAEIKIRAERRAGELLAAMAERGERIGPHSGAKKTGDAVALDSFGVTKKQSSQWQTIASLTNDEFEAEVAAGESGKKELTSAGVVKRAKQKKRKDDIQKQRDEIESGEIKLPKGVFEIIAIDPPWKYDTADQYDPSGFRGGTPYPEMSVDELAELELPAAKDCVLWLWTTHKFMRHAFTLLDAWGFEEKVIITWAKDRMGTGRWLRSQSEFCIMAVKGCPKVDLTNQTTVLHAPMRQHSRKPDEFYKLVESLCIGRRLDYFSREKRTGWGQVGNDPDKFREAV